MSMTIQEFAKKGGDARAKSLSKARRVEIARMAGKAKRKAEAILPKPSNYGKGKTVY